MFSEQSAFPIVNLGHVYKRPKRESYPQGRREGAAAGPSWPLRSLVAGNSPVGFPSNRPFLFSVFVLPKHV